MNEDKLLTAAHPTPPAGGTPAPTLRPEDMREFAELFPAAAQDPQAIPQEVWTLVRQGRSLVGAYVQYLLSRAGGGGAPRRDSADRWNAETAARSTGSMRSADGGLGRKDPFLQGLMEGE